MQGLAARIERADRRMIIEGEILTQPKGASTPTNSTRVGVGDSPARHRRRRAASTAVSHSEVLHECKASLTATAFTMFTTAFVTFFEPVKGFTSSRLANRFVALRQSAKEQSYDSSFRRSRLAIVILSVIGSLWLVAAIFSPYGLGFKRLLPGGVSEY
jgi:hypothetical protein